MRKLNRRKKPAQKQRINLGEIAAGELRKLAIEGIKLASMLEVAIPQQQSAEAAAQSSAEAH